MTIKYYAMVACDLCGEVDYIETRNARIAIKASGYRRRKSSMVPVYKGIKETVEICKTCEQEARLSCS